LLPSAAARLVALWAPLVASCRWQMARFLPVHARRSRHPYNHSHTKTRRTVAGLDVSQRMTTATEARRCGWPRRCYVWRGALRGDPTDLGAADIRDALLNAAMALRMMASRCCATCSAIMSADEWPEIARALANFPERNLRSILPRIFAFLCVD